MSAAAIAVSWPPHDADGRTHQPVRRKSRPSLGPDEPAFRISDRQRQAYLRAFDKVARNTKPKGVRRGRVGGPDRPGTYSWAARQVYDYLLGWAVSTGRVYPSLKQIAAELGMALSHVVRVVNSLVAGGFIARERRFRRIANGGAGPQVEQDTNFYRIRVPTAAGQLLETWMRAKDRRAGISPEERERRLRASRVAAERRQLEESLAVARKHEARATRASDRRRLASMVIDLERAVEAAKCREAAILSHHEHTTSGGPGGPPDSARFPSSP